MWQERVRYHHHMRAQFRRGDGLIRYFATIAQMKRMTHKCFAQLGQALHTHREV
jgi:hypothetical protein